MKQTNLKFSMRPALAACLCVLLLMGCMGAAYAADVGGIRETIQIWINGRLVDAGVLDYSDLGNGNYEFVIDAPEDGNVTIMGGGGVAFGNDGSARPLTPEEVADDFATQVDTDEQGRVWLYRYDQSYDITDLLVNGACKVSLDNEGNPLYFDIEDNGGGGYRFSMSSEPTGSPADYMALK